MAYNYSIQFKSFRTGIVYTLNIGGGTGEAIPLVPGAQPFITQENDSEDEFTPVRTQTGYLRIVDDGKDANGNDFNWKDLIPAIDTSRPLTLTHQVSGSPVVDWVGFMQAQTFSGVLYGNPQEREFPIQCSLSVTEGTDVNYQQTAIQNFAYLLNQFVTAIPSDQRPTEILIQGGATAQTMLLTMIDWQNFANLNNENTMEARYSIFQCFDDMCKFWGWTARMCKQKLYLTCADDADMPYFLKMTPAELETMAGGTSAGTITSETYFDLSISSGFASIDNSDTVVRGYNKAEVQADINVADGAIIDTDTDLMYKLLTSAGWQSVVEETGGVYRYTNDQLTIAHPILTFACTQNNASLNFAQLQDNETGDKAEVSMIRILKSYNTVSPTVHASVELKYEHVYSKNWLELHADIYRKYVRLDTSGDATQGTKKMYVRIGIKKTGYQTMWLQPNGTWANTNTPVQLTIGNEDNRLWFYHPNAVDEPVTVERREIPDNISGTLFFEFMGSNDLDPINGERSFDIANLQVVMYHGDIAEYTYQNHFWWKFEQADYVKQTVSYKAKNQNNVKEDFNADVIFASDNNVVFGYGLLSNPNRSYFKGIQYEPHGTLDYPEQHLADRAMDYWQKSRRRLDVELLVDTYAGSFYGDINPRHKITLDGTLTHPIAISRNWADDVVKLTLLEMPVINEPE